MWLHQLMQEPTGYRPAVLLAVVLFLLIRR
jgi:hypothetical protein